MARVREFNPKEALDKAMRLFWRKGYADTSMRDVVAHTGVAHAGLYNEFGGKRQLYQAALKHYDATFGNRLIGPLETPDAGRAEVEGLFAVVLDAVKSGRFADGCFMCNTAVEFGNDAEDVLGGARHNIERMARAFETALDRARGRKEVRADLDPGATADFLVSVFHGVAVLSRSKCAPERIEHSIRQALATLD